MQLAKFVTLAAFAALALPASAQTDSTKRIDKRQDLQEQRIEKGVQKGQLTKKEAARLEKGQARVQKMEDKAVADGRVSAKERARIEKAQDKQSRKIHRERHDKQAAR